MVTPVAIRTKNPGAMWPGPVATRFGSTQYENLKDGNKAAIFPTFEQGAAAQFYLWATKYSGMTLEDAIYKWSGHNSSPQYAAFLAKKVPGLSMKKVITKSFLASADGLKFMKAQAQWETGQPFPMTDAQWKRGQEIAFNKVPLPLVSDNESEVKPVIKSKTIWGGLVSFLGGIGASIFGAFQYIATPWGFAALVFLVAVITIGTILVIKGRLDVNKVIRRLAGEKDA